MFSLTMFSIKILILIFIIIQVSQKTKAALYMSQHQLDPLLKTYKSLIKVFDKYLENEEEKIAQIRKKVNAYSERNKKNPRDLVENPINAYKLIRSLSVDLDDFLKTSEENSKNFIDLPKEILQIRNTSLFPLNSDLDGSIKNLLNLQEFYNLSISDLKRGNIGVYCCIDPLKEEEVFQIGKHLYNMTKYETAIQWFKEAYSNIKNEKESSDKEIAILDYLAYANFQLSRIKNAINLTKKILKIDPYNAKGKRNLEYFERALEINGERRHQSKQPGPVDESTHVHYFQTLCKSPERIIVKNSSKLKCGYFYGGDARNKGYKNPFYLIGPFKEEILHSSPKIAIYHNIIHKSEIEALKNLGINRIANETAEMNNKANLAEIYQLAANQPASIHEGAKWVFIKDKKRIIQTLNRRIEYLTGLNMKTSDPLEIANYGISGMDIPHFDFFGKQLNELDGNRMATVLFFLSKVRFGGATVFPVINLKISPIVGSGLFWHNSLRDGKVDFASFYGSCPIIMGSKWVSIKWIREKNQDLRCDLKPSENTNPLIK